MDKQYKIMIMKQYNINPNTSAMWQHAVHTTDQPSSFEPDNNKKANLLKKNIEEFSGKRKKKPAKWSISRKGDRAAWAAGLKRRTREEMVKWKQMKFQSGGRHQTSPASLRGKFRQLVS